MLYPEPGRVPDERRHVVAALESLHDERATSTAGCADYQESHRALAPMPSASVATATAANAGCRRRSRTPCRRSWISASMAMDVASSLALPRRVSRSLSSINPDFRNG